MFGQEFKRIFQNIWIWMAFLLFLFLGIYVSDFIVQSEYQRNNTSFEAYTELSMQYDGRDIDEVCEKLTRRVEAVNGLFGEEDYASLHLNWVLLNHVKALSGYSEFLAGVKEGRGGTIFDSAYVRKRTERAKKDYAGLSIDITTWNANESAEVFFVKRSMDVFLLLFIFVVIYYMFLIESEGGMLWLTRTTKYGIRRFFLVKQLLLLLCSVGTVVIYELAWLLYLVCRYGAFTPEARLQSISVYMNCRYDIRVWQGIILYILLKMLAVYGIALAVSLLAVVCRRTITTLTSLVLIAASSVLLYKLLGYNMTYDVLTRLNPIELMDLPARALSYDFVNLFGEPVSLFTYQMIMSLLLMMACLYISMRFYGAAERKRRYHIIKRKKKEKPIRLFLHGMVANEGRKLFLDYLVLIPYLLFAAAICLFVGKGGGLPMDMNEQFYKNYMEEFRGELTPEKEARIQEEKAYFEELRELEMQILINQEGTNALGYIEMLLMKQQAFERVLSQYERIQKREDSVFLYDTGYSYLDGQRDYKVRDVVILFALVVMAVLVPYCNYIEYEKGAYGLVRTTRYGTVRQPAVRWGVQAVATAGFTLFIYAVCFGNVMLQYGSYGLTQRMHNLAWAEGFTGELPIIVYFVLQMLVWEAVSLIFMSALYTITNMTKDYVKTVLLGLLLGPLPYYIIRFV